MVLDRSTEPEVTVVINFVVTKEVLIDVDYNTRVNPGVNRDHIT